MLIVNQFKISKCAPSKRRVLKRYLMWFTCTLPICKHSHEDKQPHNAKDALCDWIHFWEFRPCALYKSKKDTQEKTAEHMSWKSVWMKRLVSLSSVKSSHCAVMLQKFTDFKSLDIVPSITGHWCHGPIWVSVNTFNICSQSQSSQNIFRAHLWCPHFFHRTVSSSARRRHISTHLCVCAHVPACAHTVINTPFSMSDKSMKNGME